MVSDMAGSKAWRAVVGASLRTTREGLGLSREAVIFRLTEMKHPVSVSTLARWEDTGNLKVEDAYYLSQVYGTNPREQLLVLPFPPSPKALRGGADPALAGFEEDLRAADEAAPDEEDQAPPDDEEDVP